jgi:hypothetical protein
LKQGFFRKGISMTRDELHNVCKEQNNIPAGQRAPAITAPALPPVSAKTKKK